MNMVTHMKTTVDIAHPLLDAAKRLAARERTTLRALIEQGLRKVVEEHRSPCPFKLRRATFAGRGLREGLGDGDWSHIRAAAYEERGG